VCEKKISATSHDGAEARQVAHGGWDALQRRIGFGLNLEGDFRRKLCGGWH